MPFPPQGPQGPMGFAQPRPPLMGYGGMFSLWLYFFRIVEMCFSVTFELILSPSFQQVDLLTPPTNMEEAEATMTTSVDKVATWGSHATSGETTVRVIFILLWAVSIFCYWRVFKPLFLMIISILLSWVFVFSPRTLNHLRMSRGDPRNIVEYRDLDAPDDMDFF